MLRQVLPHIRVPAEFSEENVSELFPVFQEKLKSLLCVNINNQYTFDRNKHILHLNAPDNSGPSHFAAIKPFLLKENDENRQIQIEK